MEKELYEYLLYTGQQEFYNDMMRERRTIREARMREAQRRAERKAMWIDIIIGGGAVAVGIGIIVWLVTFVAQYS